MGERAKVETKKRGFWDLIKESGKGLGIIFPDGNEKQTPKRPVSAVPKRPVRQTPSASASPTTEAPIASSTVENLQSPPASEIISDLMAGLKAESEMKGHSEIRKESHNFQPLRMVNEAAYPREPIVAVMDEATEKYLKNIQSQLGEIRRTQLEYNQNTTPVIVENALEKFFYWVQEKNNQQLESSMKEVEQRLSSGQLEILMELRSLVNQTDELILAEQRIGLLERQCDRQKTKFRVLLVFFLVVVGGSAFGIWWVWLEGFLKIRPLW